MWTFAFDFWKSKTTHLALVTLGAALYAVIQNKIPVPHAVFAVAVTTGIAFLRDAHVKALNDVADILGEIADKTSSEPDGEADAPVVTPEQSVPAPTPTPTVQ